MHKFVVGGATMFLTFALGLAANSLVSDFGNVVERWLESPPVLEEPSTAALKFVDVLLAQPEVIQTVPHCPSLVVNIGNDRSLWLGFQLLGNLDNPSGLVVKLNEEFALHGEDRSYISGLGLGFDVPEAGCIAKTVLINSPRWISYGEMSDLGEVIKTTGAKPIGLVPGSSFR